MLADWSTLQPHCRPTGHHSYIPCRPTGHLQHILSADWSSLQPHCRPPGHLSNISCRPPHQPHYPTVGRLVNPSTPLSADWSSLQPHCRPTGHHSNIPCRPTGHLSNISCQPTGHHSIPTVGCLVTSPTYPVGHPISPTTPLSATWSSL